MSKSTNPGNEGAVPAAVHHVHMDRDKRSYWQRAHHDWRFWVGMLLMLCGPRHLHHERRLVATASLPVAADLNRSLKIDIQPHAKPAVSQNRKSTQYETHRRRPKTPLTKLGSTNGAKPGAGPAAKGGSKNEVQNDLKSLPMPELLKKLGSSPDGLSQAEAQKRLAQYGPNEIKEKKTNAFLKFLTYFWGPIPWMIEAAVILSGVVRHWPDFFIILLLLCSNAVVGFWEEHQAGNAIAALKAKLAINAKVKRDGKWTDPKARNWCRATSSVCGWATLCRPMRACWRATQWKWISPR